MRHISSSHIRRLAFEQFEERQVLSSLFLGAAAQLAPTPAPMAAPILDLPAVQAHLAHTHLAVVNIAAEQAQVTLSAGVSLAQPAPEAAPAVVVNVSPSAPVEPQSAPVNRHEAAIAALTRVIDAAPAPAVEHLETQLDRLTSQAQEQAAGVERVSNVAAHRLVALEQPPAQILKQIAAERLDKIALEELQPVQADAAHEVSPETLQRTEPSAKTALTRTGAVNQQLLPPRELDAGVVSAAAATAQGAGTSEALVQTSDSAGALFDAGGVAAPAAGREWGATGVRLPSSGEQFELEGPVAISALTSAADDHVGLEGGDLAAGTAALSTAALDAALQQFLENAEELARNLGHAVAGGGVLSWLTAAIAAIGTMELYRRKQRKLRVAFAAANLSADSTFSWMPGMPGSYSDEDA